MYILLKNVGISLFTYRSILVHTMVLNKVAYNISGRNNFFGSAEYQLTDCGAIYGALTA